MGICRHLPDGPSDDMISTRVVDTAHLWVRDRGTESADGRMPTHWVVAFGPLRDCMNPRSRRSVSTRGPVVTTTSAEADVGDLH